MTFSLKNLKIKISFYFVAIISLVCVYDKSNLSLFFFIAMFIHETGHLILILLYKIKIKEIYFHTYGIKIEIDNIQILSNAQEIIILLSGAIANFIAAAIIHFFKIDCYPLFISNLIIGIFNLLPVDSLDGGKITNILLFSFLPMKIAYNISIVILIIFTTLFFTLNFFSIIHGRFNLTLTILCGILISKIIKIKQ